jgi:hypothetical protein
MSKIFFLGRYFTLSILHNDSFKVEIELIMNVPIVCSSWLRGKDGSNFANNEQMILQS